MHCHAHGGSWDERNHVIFSSTLPKRCILIPTKEQLSFLAYAFWNFVLFYFHFVVSTEVKSWELILWGLELALLGDFIPNVKSNRKSVAHFIGKERRRSLNWSVDNRCQYLDYFECVFQFWYIFRYCSSSSWCSSDILFCASIVHCASMH
jgi:hypothetical protein